MNDANRLALLVEPLPRLDSVSTMPDLLALVLGRLADGRLAGVLPGILLETLL